MQQASRRSKWSSLPFAGFLVAVIVLGCGGSGGSSGSSSGGLTSGATSGATSGSTGGTTFGSTGSTTGTTSGGSTGGTTPDDQRMAVLAAVQAKQDSFTHKDLAADNAAMYAYLKSRPDFEAVGTDQLCSWARFKDGRLLIVYNNMQLSTEPAGPAATTSGKYPTSKSTTAQTRLIGGGFPGDVPESTQARALNSLGSVFDTENGNIEEMWKQVGYNVLNQDTSKSEKDASIENLYNVKGDGVFLFTTHGGSGEAKDKQKVFCLNTATSITKANDLLHKTELDAGELVYSCGIDDEVIKDGKVTWTNPMRYAITDRFVRKHWHFLPGSLVYFGCCYGYDEKLRSAVMDAGAENYFGWTTSTDIVFCVAANYLMSRTTGSFSGMGRIGNGNYYRYDTARPTSRAFSYQETYDYMASKLGLTKCKTAVNDEPASQLMYAHKDNVFGELAPSIYRLQPNEELHQLSITGRFGGTQGTVTIGGQPVTIKTWAPAMIVTSLPDSGPGSSGEVVVTVRNHPSNKAMLTMWTTVLHYRVKGPGTLFQKADFDISWRGDAREVRNTVDGPVAGIDFGTVPTLTSKVTYDIGGSYQHPDGCVETWEATQPTIVPRSSATSLWNVTIDGSADTFDTSLAPSVQVGNGWKQTMTCGGQASSTTLAFSTYFKKLFADCDDKLGTQAYTTTDNVQNGTITWSWDSITAVNPPDPEEPA